MNLSWANQIAKTALKTAQQKIDSVLDIRPGDGEASVSSENIIADELLASTTVPLGISDDSKLDLRAPGYLSTSISTPPGPTTMYSLSSKTGQPSNTVPPSTSSGSGDKWSSTNAWNNLATDQNLVVDSEPNPIRDEGHQTTVPLFDHSPSSNSSDGIEPGQSPQKVNEYEENKRDVRGGEQSVYVDVDLSVPSPDEAQFISSSDTIQEDNVVPPLPDIARRNSHQDDSITVASSDIEVIRNADAWSIISSKPATDQLPSHVLTTKPDTTESFRTQLLHAEQRRNELKAANDTLQSNNAQLQQRIIVLNQQQCSLKKELEEKTTELEDLLAEGKRLSDHSGKQAREIRRLKSELSELEKVKAERKRIKEEKQRAEETIELQKEEITSLKGMVKQLEASAEQLSKEQSAQAAITEVAQKHAQEQSKLVVELQREVSELHVQIDELRDANKVLTRETELMQSANWSERLAGERANETVVTISTELLEARAHIERLRSQLQSTENRLEVVLNERNSVAESISQTSIPLLEEINNLKQQLHCEEQCSEEANMKMRTLKKELDVVTEQCNKIKEINRSLINQHHQELTVVNHKVQYLEQELARVHKEREDVAANYKSARALDASAMKNLREENVLLSNSLSDLRTSLNELREENDTLKTLLEEARAQSNDQSQQVEEMPQSQLQKESIQLEGRSFDDVTSTTQVAPFSLNSSQDSKCRYDTSQRRIAFFEQEAARCVQLEDQVRELKKQLQALNSQYNGLLIVDGERLERIEELEHDVIDLRQLLREQLLAFAEVRMAENEDKS